MIRFKMFHPSVSRRLTLAGAVATIVTLSTLNPTTGWRQLRGSNVWPTI